ncbi:hypothetical protein [Mycetocola sp. 2940]|uniref:hypothetical protein n=1 Tax=Mycetocola sp. 2940 TaxID=3156452 RepID=UPI00339855B9
MGVAVAVFEVLGFETAVASILITSSMDTDAAVTLAGELYGSPAFLIPLLVGLGGIILRLSMLASPSGEVDW